MIRRPTLLLAVAVLSWCGACAKCGPRPGALEPIERLLPKDAAAVAVAPSIERVGASLRGFERLRGIGFAARFLLFPSAKALMDSFMDRLGLDLRDPEEVEAAGVDAKGSAAFFRLADDSSCLIVPVEGADRFDAHVQAMALRQFDADERVVATSRGVETTTFHAGAEGEAAIGYARSGRLAVLCTGAAVGQLSRLVKLSESESLNSDPSFRAALARRSPRGDAWFYLPTGAPQLEGLPVASGLVSVAVSEREVYVEVDATWGADAAWLGLFEGRAAVDLRHLMPDDAVLTVQLNGDPTAVAVLAETELDGVSQVLSEAGFDWREHALAHVSPGIALALSVNPKPAAWRLPEGDPRYRNRFKFFQLSAACWLKEPGVAGPALERVAALAPGFGSQMRRETRAGRSVFRTTDLSGEGVSFGSVDEWLFFAAPVDRLDELLRADAGTAPQPKAGADGVVATLDFGRIVRAFRAMPTDYFGVSGSTLAVAMQGWFDALGDLGVARLSARTQAGAVQARVEVELTGAAPSR